MDIYRGLNLRTLGQVRGTNGGASSFPFVIYNDNYDFNEYITAVANTAFAGVLWSPEVRGGDGEDMLRRIQAVCFSPLALFNGWATDTKLWTHAEVADGIRDAIVLRMRLLPYWYTAFAQYHEQGTPVVRPLALVEGRTVRLPVASARPPADPYAIEPVPEVKDEYLVGDVVARSADRARCKVANGRLALGQVVRFLHRPSSPARAEPSPSTPPLTRDSAVRQGRRPHPDDPRAAVRSRNQTRCCRSKCGTTARRPGRGDLYDDDGETFDYERGARSWTRVRMDRAPDGQWSGSVIADPSGAQWRYASVTWVHMTQ